MNKKTSSLRHLWLAKLLGVATFLLVIGITNQQHSAYAQNAPLRFIRDAEIEAYLRQLATPLFRAADIDPNSVTINLIESRTVNAFVASGMNEFFYTGLLQLTETPEQLAGVIAHETGHIAGGHLVRGREEMRNASRQAILGMIVGLAAGIASGNGQAAAGAISGGQHLAQQSLLSFSRTQESSADEAGMSFLDSAGISSRGMTEFFEKLKGQEMLPVERQAEYVRTHPLTQDRIDAVEHHLENSPLKNAKLSDELRNKHDRMRAKLMGFLQPETALLRYTENDQRITARYALAIALYRTHAIERALALTNGLIKQEPKNPYFHELKGQILFENGRVDESLASYKTANDLSPNSSLLRASYGHALLESKGTGNIDAAIKQLQESVRIERDQPSVWRFLAVAWGRKAAATQDNALDGLASYALSEEALAKGDEKEAGRLAERALKTLNKTSPYWLRAQDIKLSTGGGETENKKKK